MKTTTANSSSTLFQDRPLSGRSTAINQDYALISSVQAACADRRITKLEIIAYALFGFCALLSVGQSTQAMFSMNRHDSIHAVVTRALPQTGTVVQAKTASTPAPEYL